MSTSQNYHTRFTVGEKVRIALGFYLGRTGTVLDYWPNTTLGFDRDNLARGITPKAGFYDVKIGWFKTIRVMEEALESVKE